jgi:hypothetical protein
MDTGDLIMFGCVASMMLSIGGTVFFGRLADDRPWLLALCAFVCTCTALIDYYAIDTLFARHDDFVWFTTRVGQAMIWALLVTFLSGLFGAAISFARAARSRKFSVAIALPWLIYLWIIVDAIYNVAKM